MSGWNYCSACNDMFYIFAEPRATICQHCRKKGIKEMKKTFRLLESTSLQGLHTTISRAFGSSGGGPIEVVVNSAPDTAPEEDTPNIVGRDSLEEIDQLTATINAHAVKIDELEKRMDSACIKIIRMDDPPTLPHGAYQDLVDICKHLTSSEHKIFTLRDLGKALEELGVK